MHLTIDFLPLIDVGALIGERGLDGAVGERMEHDARPEHVGRGLLGQALNLFRILAAEVAVDREELLQRVPVWCDFGAGLEDRRHDAIEEPIVELDAASLERLRERQMIEFGAGGVAGFILRVREHRRVHVLIEPQGEERDLHGGIGDVHALHLGAAGRVARDT